MKVMIMVDLVLVKKTMLRYINSVGSDHHVVLCNVRLVSAWIKSREVVNKARRIKSEKLREQ